MPFGMEENLSYEFGPFRLVPAERQLLRDNQPVSLTPKAFDTLVTLVQNSGHALKKDDLIKQVWPDSFVEESNLNHNISLVRKALGDGKNGDGYVETVRGFGFRFNADVRRETERDASVLVHRRTRTQVVVKEQTTETQRYTRVEHPIENRRLLRPLAITLGLFVAVFGIAVWYFFLRSPANPNPQTAPVIRSVAVLPFKPLGLDNSEDYLGLSMADSLITKLGKIGNVNVRPTSAIQKYTDEARDPISIGRELKVDAVIDGRIQKSGERLRITIQLLEIKDGRALWSENIDGKFSDIFTVQDFLSKQVALAVTPNLTAPEIARLIKHGTDNADAYQAYLKGRYHWSQRTTESLRLSVEYFQQAIARDPNYALAYDGLADAYLIFDVPKAEPALRKALELDETLGEAHASLGFLRMFWHWDWQGAEIEFKRAIELKPNYATAYQWYALWLAAQGRLDEAKKEMGKAIELDPLSPNMRADLAQIHYFAHQYDEAIADCRQALDLDPNFSFAHHNLVAIYTKKGMQTEAVTQQLKAEEGRPATINLLRETYAKSGWPGFLQALLQSEGARTAHARKAWLYAVMGDNSNALKEIERACDDRDFFLTFLKVEPAYDNLRGEPRFQHVLKKMNL